MKKQSPEHSVAGCTASTSAYCEDIYSRVCWEARVQNADPPVRVLSQPFALCTRVFVVFQQRVLRRESQQTQVHASSEEAECQHPSPLLLSGRGNERMDSSNSL